jgi:hypothetical protein
VPNSSSTNIHLKYALREDDIRVHSTTHLSPWAVIELVTDVSLYIHSPKVAEKLGRQLLRVADQLRETAPASATDTNP